MMPTTDITSPSISQSSNTYTYQTTMKIAYHYYEMIQATHHASIFSNIISSDHLPPGLLKIESKVRDMIKPALANEEILSYIHSATESWMQTIVSHLASHYNYLKQDLAEFFHYPDQHDDPFSTFHPPSFQIASQLAIARYKDRLNPTTLATVQESIMESIAMGNSFQHENTQHTHTDIFYDQPPVPLTNSLPSTPPEHQMPPATDSSQPTVSMGTMGLSNMMSEQYKEKTLSAAQSEPSQNNKITVAVQTDVHTPTSQLRTYHLVDPTTHTRLLKANTPHILFPKKWTRFSPMAKLHTQPLKHKKLPKQVPLHTHQASKTPTNTSSSDTISKQDSYSPHEHIENPKTITEEIKSW